MDYEVKADPLEAAFDGVTDAPPAILRPVLAGAATIDPARAAFVDGFLRRGLEVELKSVSGAVLSDGGYAVPREIDAQIDATLKSISPIRAIANVVKVGTAGYRKLVTVGGTASGWAARIASAARKQGIAAPQPSPTRSCKNTSVRRPSCSAT